MRNKNLTAVRLQRHFGVHQYASNIELLINECFGRIHPTTRMEYQDMIIRLLDPYENVWDIQIPFYDVADASYYSSEKIEATLKGLRKQAIEEYDATLDCLKKEYEVAYLNDECTPSSCAALESRYNNFHNVNFYSLWIIRVHSCYIHEKTLRIRISTDYSGANFYNPNKFWEILSII